MSRLNDTGLSASSQSSVLTVEEVLPTYTNITSQPKLPVTIVQHPSSDVQHFSIDLASILGPDGKKIAFSSQAAGAPSGQSIAVLDSGTSLAYVTRAVSDAIYGRVQRAEYNTDQAMWMIPCEQELNVTLVFSGVSFPIHPLDAVIRTSSFFDSACGRGLIIISQSKRDFCSLMAQWRVVVQYVDFYSAAFDITEMFIFQIAPNVNPSPEFDHLMGDTISGSQLFPSFPTSQRD